MYLYLVTRVPALDSAPLYTFVLYYCIKMKKKLKKKVMEFLPSTLHRCIQSHASSGGPMNLQTTKIVSWQVLRKLKASCTSSLRPHALVA